MRQARAAVVRAAAEAFGFLAATMIGHRAGAIDHEVDRHVGELFVGFDEEAFGAGVDLPVDGGNGETGLILTMFGELASAAEVGGFVASSEAAFDRSFGEDEEIFKTVEFVFVEEDFAGVGSDIESALGHFGEVGLELGRCRGFGGRARLKAFLPLGWQGRRSQRLCLGAEEVEVCLSSQLIQSDYLRSARRAAMTSLAVRPSPVAR